MTEPETSRTLFEGRHARSPFPKHGFVSSRTVGRPFVFQICVMQKLAYLMVSILHSSVICGTQAWACLDSNCDGESSQKPTLMKVKNIEMNY